MKTRMKNRNRQAGMSLIELMIAMVVLVVGMLAALAMVVMAISTNNRNKLDTTGTMVAQMVVENIAAQAASSVNQLEVTDCQGTVHTISTEGAADPGAGATVDPDATSPFSPGDIDWSVAYADIKDTYKMQFVTCDDAGIESTYEVRWNIRTITGFTKLVTVSSRQIAATSEGAFYAQPVTLRTIAGQ